MNKTWKKKLYALLVILFVFSIICYLYRLGKTNEIKSELSENATFISEPLWNYDIEMLEDYLKVVVEKNSYKYLKIKDKKVGTNGDNVFLEISVSQPPGFKGKLSELGLLPELLFEHEIVHEQGAIGAIEVLWIDYSIIFYAYCFFISALLYIISLLYFSMSDAKKSLERQFSELKFQKDYIENIFDIVPEGLITLSEENNVIKTNNSFDLLVNEWAEKCGSSPEETKNGFVKMLSKQASHKPSGHYSMTDGDQTLMVEYTLTRITIFHDVFNLISLRDVTRLKSLERQLAQGQKLEAVGRLASGIAHEINTPTQYVLTNINFLHEAIEDVADIMQSVKKLVTTPSIDKLQTAKDEIEEQLLTADWDFLEDEMPSAVNQSIDGLHRISKIIKAMKHFSHPSGDEPKLEDINYAIRNTVSVASNEWKYVCKVKLELDQSIPEIPCYLDELNQVFLILIVNSAHAILEKNGDEGASTGEIVIETKSEEEQVIITFRDNGIGIPEKVKAKIFDPFFTTKEVDKGTGQGLAIAHDVVIKKHNGKIGVESVENEGTVFTISIPTHLSTVSNEE